MVGWSGGGVVVRGVVEEREKETLRSIILRIWD
jgi:hypothetical protein